MNVFAHLVSIVNNAEERTNFEALRSNQLWTASFSELHISYGFGEKKNDLEFSAQIWHL